jgi:hypothetical protein
VIEANVTGIVTEVPVGRDIRVRDLALKSHERLFFERVPLPPAARERIKFTEKWRYAALAEGVEAWGFRAMQADGEFRTRAEIARDWFDHEYLPLIDLLAEEDLIGRGTEAEAYARVVSLRYLLLRTHAWDEEVFARLREEMRRPEVAEDTLVHRLLDEMS